MEEIWKDVPGFEGLYQVSNLGGIRRFWYLRGSATVSGYQHVALYKNKKKYTRQLHCLVAATFIGPKEKGYDVNHKDANKQNNALENLEYLTHQDNMTHAAMMGLMQKGEKHFRKRHPELIPRGYHYCRPPMSEEHRRRLGQAQKGKISPFRKLTFQQATAIRESYANGGTTLDELAAEYKVCQRTIMDIIALKKYLK
jgi:hypothetical protein